MLAGWFVPDMGIFFASGNGNREENLQSGFVSLGQGMVDHRFGCQKRGLYSHFGGIKQVRVGTMDMLDGHAPAACCAISHLRV
jgi:hypothetical protein